MKFAWRAAIAPLLTTAPLLGMSLRSDERRAIYQNSVGFAEDPLYPVVSTVDDIESFIRVGNFRPVGRFFEVVGHVGVFESALLTGIAPHVWNAILGSVMVALLAVSSAHAVRRFCATPTTRVETADEHRLDWLCGTALAITLIAAGTANGLVQFPLLFIGSAALILGVPFFVCRDEDILSSPRVTPALILVFFVGALCAATYDMVYITPPLAAVFLVLRSWTLGVPAKAMHRTNAAGRLVVFCLGFLTIFLPVRWVIAMQCSSNECYEASDVQLSVKGLGAFVVRLISAAPPTGWVYTDWLIGNEGLVFGVAQLVSNPKAWVAFAIFVILGRLVATTKLQKSLPDRTLVAMFGFGIVMTVLGSLLVSLSADIQTDGPAPGGAWRESMVTQTGAAIAGVAAVIFVLPSLNSRRAWLTTGLVAMSLFATFHSNFRTLHIDRQNPVSVAVREISESMVNFETSAAADERRCDLLEDYLILTEGTFAGGEETEAIINDLMRETYGAPFCELAK